jgi:hypothetical protein
VVAKVPVNHKSFCKQNIGNLVEIQDKTGKIHYGKIEKLDDKSVYIKELQKKGLGGHGYGFFNPFCNAFFNPFIFSRFVTPLFFRNIISCRPCPFTPFI